MPNLTSENNDDDIASTLGVSAAVGMASGSVGVAAAVRVASRSVGKVSGSGGVHSRSRRSREEESGSRGSQGEMNLSCGFVEVQRGRQRVRQRGRPKRIRIEETENTSDNSTDNSIIDDAVSVGEADEDGAVEVSRYTFHILNFQCFIFCNVQVEESRGDMETEIQSQVDETEDDVPAWMTDDEFDEEEVDDEDEIAADGQLNLECRDGVEIKSGGSGSWEWQKDLGHHQSQNIPPFPDPISRVLVNCLACS